MALGISFVSFLFFSVRTRKQTFVTECDDGIRQQRHGSLPVITGAYVAQ
jgi:hypothetical protein